MVLLRRGGGGGGKRGGTKFEEEVGGGGGGGGGGEKKGRTKVEEEVGEDVEGEEGAVGLQESVVGEADDAEEDGQHDEAHELDGFAANGVDRGDGDPVPRDGAGADEDQVADSGLAEGFVDVGTGGVADGGEDGGVVQAQAVEGHVEEEPGAGRAEEDLAVLPFAVVRDEILEAGFGDLEALLGVVQDGSLADGIGVALAVALEVGARVLGGLLDIASDIEGVAGGFRDGETVVESDAAGDRAEADDHTPHLVHGELAVPVAHGDGLRARQGTLEASGTDQRNETRGQLSDTLHGEDGAHHGASPLRGREFRCDDGRQGVVASDADPHEHTPEDDEADDGHGGRSGRERLREGGEDDEDELESVHLLPTDEIRENPEADLTDDRSSRRGDLDGCIRVGGDRSWLALGVFPVDDAQHVGDQIDGEDVVGIGEETDPGHDHGPDVIPSKGRFVNLGERESSALIGVCNVGIYEGIVSAGMYCV